MESERIGHDEPAYELKLYVSGHTPSSWQVIKNLKILLEANTRGEITLRVIDVIKDPQSANNDKVFATPSVVITIVPPPIKKIIGEFCKRGRILLGLNVTEQKNGVNHNEKTANK